MTDTGNKFDFNTFFTAALHTVIEQATAPLRERIEELEARLTAHTESLRETASAARLEEMERKLDNLTERDDTRIRDIAESVLSEHNDKYDHDAFLTNESDQSTEIERCIDAYDFGDRITEAFDNYDLETRVTRILREATISIDV